MKLTPDQQVIHDATDTPPCPPNHDARHEAEARRLKAAGDDRAAFGATLRIGSTARQKGMLRALWGME